MSKKTAEKDLQTKWNIITSLGYQFVAMVIGLVLPRFILNAFGSEVNGIVQAVNQFLSYTVILECGLGGMIAASFYKPLAFNDKEAISDIFLNTRKFFGKISVIYLVFLFIFAFASKLVIKTDFSYTFVVSLVFVLGISNYFNYYFALAEQILLRADQKIRIFQFLQSITLVCNAVVCILLIKMGTGIHFMKIASAVVFLITPFGIKFYVKKHYSISKKIFDKERKLPSKKDGIAHHISYFIYSNTDITIITLFKGIKDVSVYSVHKMVTFAIENVLKAIGNAISAKIGNIIAKNEDKNLNTTFEIYDMVNMILSTFCCIMLALFLIPFIRIYTSGVNDVNYIRPLFVYLLVITEWIVFIRIPYSTSAMSAGHYKETKKGAVMEAVINLGVSLILVKPFGISGVIAGTLAAVTFRTIDFVFYLSGNILKRKIYLFFKSVILNGAVAILIIVLLNKYMPVKSDNLIELALNALWVSFVVIIPVTIVNVIDKLAFFRRKGRI